MITITEHNSIVVINGHADYAPKGQDIVCAAVSTAFQSLISSVEELTDDEIAYELAPGDSYVKFKSLSEETNLLLRSFFVERFSQNGASFNLHICRGMALM